MKQLNKEVISGFSAGCITACIIHPLDLIKLRLQLNATHASFSKESINASNIINLKPNKLKSVQYLSIWKNIFYKTFQSSNIFNDTITFDGNESKSKSRFKQLYRGFSINLLGNSIAWSCYFTVYKNMKDTIGRNNFIENDSVKYLISGGLSGLLTSLLTNPIWVLKTRIMSINYNENINYNNMFKAAKTIWKNEGYHAMWHGIVPAMLGVSQGAIYFMVYDNLKSFLLFEKKAFTKGTTPNVNESNENTNDSTLKKKLKPSEIITITSLSKMISTSLIYPIQLLKSNQQSFNALKNNYSLFNLIKIIYKGNGIMGFYQGLLTNLFKTIPSTCITFLVYEQINHIL